MQSFSVRPGWDEVYSCHLGPKGLIQAVHNGVQDTFVSVSFSSKRQLMCLYQVQAIPGPMRKQAFQQLFSRCYNAVALGSRIDDLEILQIAGTNLPS